MTTFWQQHWPLATLHSYLEYYNTQQQLPTRWIVLTGAPSSGKTTLLKMLKAKGYMCADEYAREYFQSQQEAGRSIEDVRSRPGRLRKQLITGTVEVENRLSPRDFVFLDRAIPDNLAFGIVEGVDIVKMMRGTPVYNYHFVFHLEPLKVESDGVREDDDGKNMLFDKLNLNVYRALGYQVVRVPRFSCNEETSLLQRLEFIEHSLFAYASRGEHRSVV